MKAQSQNIVFPFSNVLVTSRWKNKAPHIIPGRPSFCLRQNAKKRGISYKLKVHLKITEDPCQPTLAYNEIKWYSWLIYTGRHYSEMCDVLLCFLCFWEGVTGIFLYSTFKNGTTITDKIHFFDHSFLSVLPCVPLYLCSFLMRVLSF